MLGVWPLHGLCGLWGGIAAGIFGAQALGGLGGVSLTVQVLVSVTGCVYALVVGLVVYGILKTTIGIRLDEQSEFEGDDLSIPQIGAYTAVS